MHNLPAGVLKIDDYPLVTFKLGTGETKSDREWLKKKKETYEKEWSKTGQKILKKIEECCGNTFTDTSKEDGITVVLHKKTDTQTAGMLNEANPLEISLFLSKSDKEDLLKELLVRMLAQSFIAQQYEFHFRMREQTLFEDILADEFAASMVCYMVLGRKLSRGNCAEALDQAVEHTVHRLRQKTPRGKLVDLLYSYLQENPSKPKKQDILETREKLVAKLLEFLPKSVSIDQY
jgi:hypothetical protein